MTLIDTHCHLDFPEFDQDRPDVIKRARKAGVAYIINIGTSVRTTKLSVELANKNPMIYTSLGIHPHHAKEVGGKVPEEIKAFIKNKKVVAIGEVGLDYYRNLSPKDLQKKLFIDSIKLAIDNNLPVIVHARDAGKDALEILKDQSQKSKSKLRGVMHCFSADEEILKKYLKLGLYISFTCNLTFKNARNLRELAANVPSERLLLETDAPFLAPQEFRGKRNEPAYLMHLVKTLSSIYHLSEEDIARITTHNAKELFGLPIKEEPKIAYAIRDSLYLNITNECTNSCNFCTKGTGDFVKGHNLKLKSQPKTDEIIKAIGNIAPYKEIVFCGFGEPTLRLDVVKKVAKKLKAKGARIRMVTNGHGDLIHGHSIAGELKGLIDKVSISFDVDTDEKYDGICKSKFGPGTFKKVKSFAKGCRAAGIEVEATFLDLEGVDVKKCKEIAEKELGVDFRMRKINVVG